MGTRVRVAVDGRLAAGRLDPVVTEEGRGMTRPLPPLYAMVGATLAACAVFLAMVSLALTTGRPVPLPNDLRILFSVIHEANVWTWFNSGVLLLAAGICLVVAAVNHVADDGPVFHWALVSALLAGLSLDDVASLHESELADRRCCRFRGRQAGRSPVAPRRRRRCALADERRAEARRRVGRPCRPELEVCGSIVA
jgi:hypothetical protein